MPSDHSAFPITSFKGLFDRGEVDSVPCMRKQDGTYSAYMSDGLNFEILHDSLKTRSGLSKALTLASIKRVHVFKRIGEVSRFLILNSSGQIYDSTNLATPILTIPAMTDFACQVMYNRAYISPSNGITGLPGEKVYVYDGSVCRYAGGSSLVANYSVAVSPLSGNVDVGTHVFAICRQTTSGYISAPSNFVVYDAPDDAHKVRLTGLPTKQTGDAAIVIVCTKVITYTGNVNEYEYFYVPNGTITDNSTQVDLNFYDADLLNSADQLFDRLDTIPAGLGLGEFNGRLLTWGENGYTHIVRVSDPGEPEGFNGIDGYITVFPGEGYGVKNAFEYRKQLVVLKSLSSYVTQDNGAEPSSWTVDRLDPGVGTEISGVAKIYDRQGSTADVAVVADRGGLLLYNGYFVKPALSWVIQAIWERINQNYFHTVQVVQDPIDMRVYIAVPLDNATSPSHVLVMDYGDGISNESVVWSLWQFHTTPTSLFIDVDYLTSYHRLSFGSSAGNVYYIDKNQKVDDNTVIDSWGLLGPLAPHSIGSVLHVNALRFRVTGSGTLIVQLLDIDRTSSAYPPSFTLSSSPGQELYRQVNFGSEAFYLKVRVNSAGDWFFLHNVKLFIGELWQTRPA